VAQTPRRLRHGTRAEPVHGFAADAKPANTGASVCPRLDSARSGAKPRPGSAHRSQWAAAVVPIRVQASPCRDAASASRRTVAPGNGNCCRQPASRLPSAP
jgi:hypothetical protein